MVVFILGQVMIQVEENINLKCLAVEDCLTVLSYFDELSYQLLSIVDFKTVCN